MSRRSTKTKEVVATGAGRRGGGVALRDATTREAFYIIFKLFAALCDLSNYFII